MSDRERDVDPECVTCGLLQSDCCCNRRAPTLAEREFARSMRLSRQEFETLMAARGNKR